MPDEEHAKSVPLFRAYIRRKPSGLLLVTVLSAALPRPVFRSYPLDIGEAAAVERSVGHALALLPAVNVMAAEPLHRALPCGPEDENNHANKREEQHASEGNGEFKQLWCGDEVEHGSPTLTDKMYRPQNGRCGKECRNMPTKGLFSVCVGQSHCDDSYQKKNSVEANEHDSPHGLHQPRQYAEVDDEQQAGADGYAVKHLRLRVVWQGLLV